MTTAELLAALARECPDGVSFDPMAVRLLRRKVPFEDWQIENLKKAMFQLGSGLWFTLDMISDDEFRSAFEGQALEWITEYGCFSVERLFGDCESYCRQIAKPDDCTALLKHLGFSVAVWGNGVSFCSLPPPDLDDSLATISKEIALRLEETGGASAFHEIEQAMPHLTAEALEAIRKQFLPEVHAAEVNGVPCWLSTEALHLPEDFPEKLTTLVDTLVMLGEKLSVANLEFALNLIYCIRFREAYALKDNHTFRRICAKHYQGGNAVFPNPKKPPSVPVSLLGSEPEYIITYRELLKSPDSLPSKMKKYIDEVGSLSWAELKKACVQRLGCKTETSGSISASLRVLQLDGHVRTIGRSETKTIFSTRGSR